jgi:hypothetical protein
MSVIFWELKRIAYAAVGVCDNSPLYLKPLDTAMALGFAPLTINQYMRYENGRPARFVRCVMQDKPAQLPQDAHRYKELVRTTYPVFYEWCKADRATSPPWWKMDFDPK